VGGMSARYSRSGRVKPQGSGFEVATWYLMRLSGLGLFVLVLTHYLILHVIHEPAAQDADFITQMRWSNQFWRAFDWLMLMLVLFHSFVGMRTVVIDYVRGGSRTVVLSVLYLLAIGLFVIGTLVVMTLPAARVVPA
jgi:succinate dehydrogenase / fumarate reductase, membrane anchor subunit